MADRIQSTETERLDREATEFAMCLLMPEEFVRAEVKKMGGINIGDDKAISRLAAKFKVEDSLMAMRIGQLMGKA